MIIKLPILFHDEHTSTLRDCGIKVDLDDYTARTMFFLRIEGFGPYTVGNKTMTGILCNGSEFICPYPPEKVEQILSEYGIR